MGSRECPLPDELQGETTVRGGYRGAAADQEGYLWDANIPKNCLHCVRRKVGAVLLTSTETPIDPEEHPEIDCSDGMLSDGFRTVGLKRGDGTSRFVREEAGRTTMGGDEADGIVTNAALTRIVCVEG